MKQSDQQTARITTEDGIPLASTIFEPAFGESNRTIVIGSALGVPRYFYYKIARFFAQHNFRVITFDYRGIYESRTDRLSGSEIKMEHWGSRDIEAVLQYASSQFTVDQLIYLGHSCGGQIIGLAPSCREIDKMIFVASQLGDWRLWPRPYNIGLLLTWQFLKAGAAFFDYVPTKMLGIASLDLPSGVARQWARWGKTPDYLFNPSHQLDTSRYGQLDIPLLSFSFEDDIKFAPSKAVEGLHEKYQSAKITWRRIDPATYNQNEIGHWGFFKERLKDPLWDETLEWIK